MAGELELGVGLYSCKTADGDRSVSYISENGPDGDISDLITELDKQLQLLRDHMFAMKKFGVRGVFVAPEYYFSAGDGDTHRRGVPAFVKDRIIAQLEKLSDKYEGIVIVPGSIAWETGVMGQGSANILTGNLSAKDVAKPLPITQAKQAWNDPSVRDRVGSLSDTGAEKLKAQKKSKKQGKKKETRLQKNTIPILHKGSVIAEYSKASDYKESRTEHTFHVPEPYPGLFSIKTHKGELTMGLEVCLDHAAKTLQRWIVKGGKQPHLHIISSAWVQAKTCHARQNGLLLHASSETSQTGVWNDKFVRQSAKLNVSPGLVLWKGKVQI